MSVQSLTKNRRPEQVHALPLISAIIRKHNHVERAEESPAEGGGEAATCIQRFLGTCGESLYTSPGLSGSFLRRRN